MKTFVETSNLIIDLGMNNGDDTDYYLKVGARVVAVDANPDLCSKAAKRFARQIDAGTLTILNKAVDATDKAKMLFYVNIENDHWSSADIQWAAREQTNVREIVVDSISIASLFKDYGIPYFMKVDVEGADESVLDQLAHEQHLPFYLSVEDCRFGPRYLRKMKSIGYTSFKLLDQSCVEALSDDSVSHTFKKGSSGPFGDPVPGQWLDHLAIEEFYFRTVRDRDGRRLAPRTRWWDIHACARHE